MLHMLGDIPYMFDHWDNLTQLKGSMGRLTLSSRKITLPVVGIEPGTGLKRSISM